MNTQTTTNEMKIENWKHLDEIQICAQVDISQKYKKGVEEHGGNLASKGLEFFAKEMRAEAIDQMVYTHCVDNAITRIKKICEECNETHIGFADILAIINGTDKDIK